MHLTAFGIVTTVYIFGTRHPPPPCPLLPATLKVSNRQQPPPPHLASIMIKIANARPFDRDDLDLSSSSTYSR